MLPSLNKVLTYLLTNKIQFTLAGKCFGLLRSYLSIPVADQGEGPRGLRHPPYFGEKKKKESQKEEKPAGQATNTPPPPFFSSRSGSATECCGFTSFPIMLDFSFEYKTENTFHMLLSGYFDLIVFHAVYCGIQNNVTHLLGSNYGGKFRTLTTDCLIQGHCLIRCCLIQVHLLLVLTVPVSRF